MNSADRYGLVGAIYMAGWLVLHHRTGTLLGVGLIGLIGAALVEWHDSSRKRP